MSVNPKLRFEVFKRDDFTCRYCSRKTPEVILEIDHVIPRAEGGGDEIENLVTACFECNRGKGKDILTADIEEADVHEKTVLLAEREMQLREYRIVQELVRKRQNEEIEQLKKHWISLFARSDATPPYDSALRWGLKSISYYDVLELMDYAADKFDRNNSVRSRKYFLAVLRNKIRGDTNWNG